MVEVVYCFFEILAIIICLHLYHEKAFKINIYNSGFILIEIVLMQLMYVGVFSKNIYFLVYILFFIYSCLEFKKSYKITIVRCLLAVLTVGMAQMIIYIPFQFLYILIPKESIIVLCVNMSLFLFVFLIRKSGIFVAVKEFIEKKEWLIRISVCICIGFLAYSMFLLKDSGQMQMDIYVIISVFLILIVYVLVRWQNMLSDMAVKEEQIRINRMYTSAFDELIQSTRKRQHEFNNHINAIYGMHMSIDNYDELVRTQREYCEKLQFGNRFTGLLNSVKHPIISGFLFSKFTGIEAKGITINYDASVSKEELPISIYDLIEIIGILLDNAEEAVLVAEKDRVIDFQLIAVKDKIELSVKNVSSYIKVSEMTKFFEKGYSSKGNNRGLGLPKVKEFQNKYEFDIFCGMSEEDDKDWFGIRINKYIST